MLRRVGEDIGLPDHHHARFNERAPKPAPPARKVTLTRIIGWCSATSASNADKRCDVHRRVSSITLSQFGS